MGQQTIKSLDKRLGILLGILTLCLFGLTVGPKTLVQALLLLTICTGGVGGAVICGVVYLVGILEVMVLESIMHFFIGSEQKNYPILEGHLINPAVLQYVLQAKKRSFSKEKITANLLHAGWDPKIIEQAFSLENTHGGG